MRRFSSHYVMYIQESSQNKHNRRPQHLKLQKEIEKSMQSHCNQSPFNIVDKRYELIFLNLISLSIISININFYLPISRHYKRISKFCHSVIITHNTRKTIWAHIVTRDRKLNTETISTKFPVFKILLR